MARLRNNLGIRTTVRVRVLYDVIKNLAFSCGFPHYIEESLKKGIVDRQIYEEVYAYYINGNGKAVGRVSFEIDWDQYEIHSKTDSGKEISVRNDIPLIDQFAIWAEDIANYISEMQKALGVEEIWVFYRYRPEIRNDPIKDKEADAFLGLTRSNKRIEFDSSSGEQFERNMTFISEMLPELKINVASKGN